MHPRFVCCKTSHHTLVQLLGSEYDCCSSVTSKSSLRDPDSPRVQGSPPNSTFCSPRPNITSKVDTTNTYTFDCYCSTIHAGWTTRRNHCRSWRSDIDCHTGTVQLLLTGNLESRVVSETLTREQSATFALSRVLVIYIGSGNSVVSYTRCDLSDLGLSTTLPSIWADDISPQRTKYPNHLHHASIRKISAS
jgi:hypothetical protein